MPYKAVYRFRSGLIYYNMIAISFLGTGNYQTVKYQFESQICETDLFPHAIYNIFKPDKIFVVLTEEAKQKHAAHLNEKIKFQEVLIPFGKTEVELWQIFESIADNIPMDQNVIIDITHGFRSQPIIALAVAAFLRVTKNIRIEKIVYGAFEAKDSNNIAPVFDITNFLSIIDWASAIDTFLKHGNSKSLNDILSSLHEKLYLTHHQPLSVKNFGNLLNNLNQSLTFIRPEEVSNLSKELPSKIESIKSDIGKYTELKPIQFLLDKIPISFSSLVNNDKNIFTHSGFRMQSNMINYYLETEQFVQAVTLAREVIISLVCVNYDLKPIEKDDRERAESLLFEWVSKLKKKSKLDIFPGVCAEAWEKITGIRNDINHAAMRKSHSSASSLLSRSTEQCKIIIEIIHAHQSF